MDQQPYGSKRRGAVLGLVATGAGLAVAEIAVGVFAGSSSPVVPVGQVFIDRVPKWLKDWAIEQFGTSDKAVLVAGALIVVFGLGILIGIRAAKGDRATAFAMTGVVGVLGAWAVLVRPSPTFGKLVPTLVGTVVSLAVLWWLAPRPVRAGDANAQTPMMMGVDRRGFIQGAVGIGSLAAIAGGVGRLLQQRFEVDQERAALSLPSADVEQLGDVGEFELGVDGIESFVVANTNFYRIDTALVVPQVSVETWKLSISGLVDQPLELTFDDLLARPQIEKMITLSCVSNPVGGGLVGNALWRGVRLADILDEAGVQPGAGQVVSRSVDGWTCGTPTEAIMDGRDAMLAIAMNGEPLPAQHGYPVRMVVPGLYGYVSATKWVTEIRLTRWDDFDAYWVPRGWSKRGPVKTMARIDTPRNGSSGSGEIAIGGVAWAVHRGVSEVQIRVDGGEWRECELGEVPSHDTWRQWAYRLDDAPPGRRVIEVRAFDGDGVPQLEEPTPVAPNGAQGYHRISVEVGAA